MNKQKKIILYLSTEATHGICNYYNTYAATACDN